MARTTRPNTVLLLDDEMYNLQWMIEFLQNNNLRTRTFTNANQIAKEIGGEIYRCLILDLNVPVLPPLDTDVARYGDTCRRYPGLYIAIRARTVGYRERQVVIYSVHKDPAVEVEARRLGCTYIRKGRPREMKAELRDILSYDPTQED